MEYLLAVFTGFTGWEGLLFKIAIVCICVWGIRELLKWAGFAIPRPVEIVAICLLCILLLFWLFQLFGMLV